VSSESQVALNIRLTAAQEQAALLMRNNSGALPDRGGRLIRFGLGNESVAVNKRLKSADLVGIRPVLIGEHHVGRVIGQFIAIETKAAGWRGPAGDERATAQAAWMEIVKAWGGVAGFAPTLSMAQAVWRSGL